MAQADDPDFLLVSANLRTSATYRLAQIVKATGRSRSELIREAVDQYLDTIERGTP